MYLVYFDIFLFTIVRCWRWNRWLWINFERVNTINRLLIKRNAIKELQKISLSKPYKSIKLFLCKIFISSFKDIRSIVDKYIRVTTNQSKMFGNVKTVELTYDRCLHKMSKQALLNIKKLVNEIIPMRELSVEESVVRRAIAYTN